MADPFDFNNAGGSDWARNLMAFGSQMAMAANARTPQGFLQYGNGFAGPLGAGIQGGMAQAQDTAKLRSSLGLQALQGQNIQSEIESRGIQSRLTNARLEMLNSEPSFGFPGQDMPGGGQPPGPQSDAGGSGGGYRGATFEDAIFGGEGSGKNPRSSAQGYGGFIDGTWQKFAGANPHLFMGMTPDQVMATRTDPQIGPALGKEAVRWLAKENATALTRSGVEPNGQSLALAHRLDPVSAAAVMKAAPGTPMPEVLMQGFLPVMGQEKALAQTTAYLKANPDLVANSQGVPVTAGDVRAKFANVPAPSFLASAGGPRVASRDPSYMPSAAMNEAMGGAPSPQSGGSGQPADAGTMQMAEAGPPAAAPGQVPSPTPMPQPDPKIIQQYEQWMDLARRKEAVGISARAELQQAAALREQAFRAQNLWRDEQVRLGFAGPMAAAQSQGALPADLAKQGQMITPYGQAPITGGVNDPGEIGRRKSAEAQAVADVEIKKEGQLVSIRNAAENVHGADAVKRYEAANGVLGWTERMDRSFDELNATAGRTWSTTGPAAATIQNAAKTLNQGYQILTGKDLVNPKPIAAWEDLAKETKRAGMELISSQYGAAREAASTIQTGISAVPSDQNSPEGAKRVLYGIREMAQNAIDRRNFVLQNGKDGDYRGLEEQFNKQFPAQMYVRRALSQQQPYKINASPSDPDKLSKELSRYLPGTILKTSDGQEFVYQGMPAQ